MKILIVSDSHGLTEELEELRNQYPDIDYWIHCGDSELPVGHPALAGYTIVRGNCDYHADFPYRQTIDANGVRIIVTHGHREHVKSSLLPLKNLAKEQGARVVCYGHSHILHVEEEGGVLYINPGSLRFPKQRKERTYVILETSASGITAQIYEYRKGKITEAWFPG